MGYNATEDFDYVLDTFLEYVPEEMVSETVANLYRFYADQDWDTEEESTYYDLIQQAKRDCPNMLD
jgi:hypothetical protein